MSSSIQPTSIDLSLHKLRSIYQIGLSPVEKLQSQNVVAHQSFDDKATSDVCLNCIQ